ncbi:MAG: lysylphosphatidylglycerol synthase transmembrane domain-containing protein [Polyangiaceae bacterium]
MASGTGRTRTLKALLRLLGPVILLVVILKLPDRAALLKGIASANPLWLGLAVLLNPINIHLKVIRWRILLRRRGIEYSVGRAWLAFLTSAYLAMLTPGRVGDVLRVQYLKRERDVPYAEGLASVVMDRFCDLYVLAGFVAVAAVHYAPIIAGKLAWATWACVIGTVVGPAIFLIPHVPERVMGAVFRKVTGSSDGLQQFLAALRANVGWPLLITLPLTAITFLVNYVQGSMIGVAMGIHISFFDVTCLLAIASLLGLLPISVSGVGVREAFFAVIFPALALGPAVGVTFGLLVFAVIYVAITLAGFIAWQIAPPPFGPAVATRTLTPDGTHG